MSNNKQSSVEWLAERIKKDYLYGFVPLEVLLEQAKAMHEAEMVQFALFFSHAQVSRTNVIDEYKETFGGNNEQ